MWHLLERDIEIRLLNPTYQATIDVQFTILIMYMDYASILGFAVPVMLLLIYYCVILMQGPAMQQAVLHFGILVQRQNVTTVRLSNTYGFQS